jgi:hypothetical protein
MLRRLSMVKLAVVGTREFHDYTYVEEKINELGLDITLIVSGGANGVDTLAETYARNYGIPYLVFPVGRNKNAKYGWNTHGKGAGVIRNQKIVDACHEVIAFPSVDGTGTQDTLKRAEKAKKKTHVFYV